jgi:hypothetical protein
MCDDKNDNIKKIEKELDEIKEKQRKLKKN